MKNIKQIIKEEVIQYIFEGVGDRYLEKKHHIPDIGNLFKTQWSRELKKRNIKDENGKLVGNTNDTNIYMNPTNLNNFEPEVRAITDVNGNLYVAQLDGDFTHAEIVNLLTKKGMLKQKVKHLFYLLLIV